MGSRVTRPILLAFCSPADRERVDAAHYPWRVDYDGIGLFAGDPLILLAVGPEGGSALARWVEAHGLDGVVGVGLVGVTAPWADRIQRVDSRHAQWPCALPLGPIEPLHAVAQRARVGEPCPECGGSGDIRKPGSYVASLSSHEYGDPRCGACHGDGCAYALRCVIVCASDDGVCADCGSTGAVDDGEAAGMAITKDWVVVAIGLGW